MCGWSAIRTPFATVEIPSRQLTQNFGVLSGTAVRFYTITQLLHACHHGQFKHRIMRSLFCLKRACGKPNNSCVVFLLLLLLPSCPVLLPSFRFFANALIHMLCFQHVTYLSAHLFAATSIHPIRHCPCVLRLHSCQPFHFHIHIHFHFFHFRLHNHFSNVPKNVPRLSTDNNITLARHYHKNNPNVLPCLHKN